MAMSEALTVARIERAIQTVWDLLHARRLPEGFWRGHLCSSPLATATAISALAIYRQNATEVSVPPVDAASLNRGISLGVEYLKKTHKNDGGWGDTERSRSNVATTYLAVAAIHLAGRLDDCRYILAEAEAYLKSQGELRGLRNRYGADQTFVAPILTNCAIAGIFPWKSVPQLPFELAVFPQAFYRFLRMPVVSYAIPALVAVGLARHKKNPSSFPPVRLIRDAVQSRCLRVASKMQPSSGGYLEAIPLTSFVLMCLATAGLTSHPIVARALDFLLRNQREDGGWPVDVDLATWLTTLTMNAAHAAGLGGTSSDVPFLSLVSLDWLAQCQWLDTHPFTGAAPGGWGWTDQTGAVPDADDTAGALLALRNFWPEITVDQKARLWPHVLIGLQWLMDLQNRDGGWPTFCRGWGRFPFDRSAVDLTAHAIRALHGWSRVLEHLDVQEQEPPHLDFSNRFSPALCRLIERIWKRRAVFRKRMVQALNKGMRFLVNCQTEEGFWLPLWFGNEWLPGEAGPVYGTAKCLLAFAELGVHNTDCWRRAIGWLAGNQNPDGSWGRGFWTESLPPPGQASYRDHSGSVEETALAVAAMSASPDSGGLEARTRGATWLVQATEEGKVTQATPIGLYFARLWYFEELYPLIFTLEALGRYRQSATGN
ncbi:prenyltransferase/squalene oxidase repeat-containing protein [Thermogutta sp.]|uniref:prenyltransferase/squalene oxidase repeat-containing protein n=1 Tax=Thermogutta sp. TaxID=1962930 RepID=UPI003C7D6A35